jgi:hypothetical protein
LVLLTTVTATGCEAMPLATTTSELAPVSILPLAGSVKFVDEAVLGATDIVLCPKVRA